MENWRLSRIEEELESLDFENFNVHPDADPPDLGHRLGVEEEEEEEEEAQDYDSDGSLPPPPPPLTYEYTFYKAEPPVLEEASENIYSKVVVRPAYKDLPTAEDKSKEALRFITEKYDSLGKVKPSAPSIVPAAQPPGYEGITYRSGEHKQAFVPQQQQQQQQQCSGAALTSYTRYKPAGDSQSQRSTADIMMMGVREAPPPPPPPPPPPVAMGQQQQQKLPPPHFSPPVNLVSPLPSSQGTFSGLPLHGTGCSGLTDQDIAQVEMFFKSHKTDVFVCQSMANLYYGTLNSSPSRGGSNAQAEKWTFVKAGIPVLILDSGESRRKRQLGVLLAERGTGFVLWKDSMNHLSEYKSPHGTFHTMHLSTDHTKLAGFSFDEAAAAAEFIHRINILTSDPDDSILSLSGKGKKKKESKFKFRSKHKYKAPTKADISTPCCFTHITKLDRSDGMSMLSTPGSEEVKVKDSKVLPSSPGLQPPSRISTRLSNTGITART